MIIFWKKSATDILSLAASNEPYLSDQLIENFFALFAATSPVPTLPTHQTSDVVDADISKKKVFELFSFDFITK